LDQRQQQLARWVSTQLQAQWRVKIDTALSLTPVSGDASFRRYFRVNVGGRRFICVDAPVQQEASQPFVAIAKAWLAAGIAVPEVYAQDLCQGFLLLSDLGDTLLLERLDASSADTLYRQALRTLIRIQQTDSPPGYPLPHYTKTLLMAEMQLCTEWFLQRLLRLTLAPAEKTLLAAHYQQLTGSALAQPQVVVHRDYHSRNLMCLPTGELGVIDFQDAVIGPITYDLVSLLRDCYIDWPAVKEQRWVKVYIALAQQAGVCGAVDYTVVKRWFDLMGMQRQIKCVGIFSRLYLRDAKPGYLKDIPRTFGYLRSVAASYPEFAGFHQWLEQRVVPAMANCQELFGAIGV